MPKFILSRIINLHHIMETKISNILIHCLTLTLFFSCNTKQVHNFSSEPADPDNWDMSVWQNVEPGTHSGFGSLDISYPKSIPPEGQINESIKISGWKGERVNCKLLVWTSGMDEEVSIEVKDFMNKSAKVSKDNITVSVIKYVVTDQFLNEHSGSCGPRDNGKVPSHLSPDLIEECDLFISGAPGTRPVWISVDIPADAEPGIYEGVITRKAPSGTVKHAITLEVQNKVLPPPSEWPFHLDLWQNPFAIARYHEVELWTQEHIELLKPYLSMLAEAGQKCITTTINDRPWGWEKPCYDDFRSMVDWTKKKDGSWEYDYSHFDLYVNLAMECGIAKQINCYTMVPIRNDFVWFDEVLSDTIFQKLYPGTPEYEALWRPFLADFSKHLELKGWLDKTTIALDEREEEEMALMFKFIADAAPEFKITMAGFYHESVNSSIYDFSSNWRDHGRIPAEKIKTRKDDGLITTYYVACGIPEPNNFTFSPPAESCYEGWLAAAMGFDGFLRWAYNSWPEDPMMDSRYIKWPAGDTYFIYPGPLSSVRFERLREGIQDYEKIRILREELAESSTDKRRLDEFLASIGPNTLEERTAGQVINEGKWLVNELSK